MKDHKNSQSVTFFYPSKVVGGAELLFYRLAVALSKFEHLNVNYIDFKDGFIANEIRKRNNRIHVIIFKKISKIHLKDTVLVCPLSYLFEVIFHLKGNFRIFLWSIHPTALESRIIAVQRRSLRKYKNSEFGEELDLMIRKGGLYFMDLPNRDYQRNLFNLKNTTEEYLPIFVPETSLKKKYKQIENNKINVGWLGRLCTEKTNALMNVIEHCNLYLIKYPEIHITLHIIGDGDDKKLIEKTRKEERLNVILLGTLTGASLYNYLIENIDLVFAMGTSILECSSLSLATVAVDFSYSPIPTSNKFKYVYELQGYSVGEKYDPSNIYKHSFDDVINDIIYGQVKNHGSLCYEYFRRNHDIEAVQTKFIERLTKNNLCSNDIQESKFAKFKLSVSLSKLISYIKNA
ncbi:hypothetical protein EIZ47_07075 [Chryseobacterium lacus]|uniref:Glycosyltransferase n=1 Tax=Chryseobacterium lacus TaxID=2058346 RepID=A0A368MWH4_9FLAO|nr:hypothetical protein [Chryseobacterium lacus]RCU42597.1 hypothetical protein DQ356_07155 [Chryseobacterium lacus]RST27152.1 hypothetical protein EIZ47_07075 [Chryseobacterium lacus]